MQNSIKRYQAISKALGSMIRCENMNPVNQEWADKHRAAIEELCDALPSGSGFDNGSRLDWESSTPEKLVFTTAYHHMNDNGMYDGWTEHSVILTPSLEMDYRLKITGRDRNEIKEYIHECFSTVLGEDVEQWAGYPKAEAQAVAV